MRIIHASLDAITNLGSLPFVVAIMVVSWFSEAESLFWNLLWSFLATFVLISLIKLIFFKQRPENKGKKTSPSNLIDRIDLSTFPSYHSANAATLAILFSIHFHSLVLTFFFAFMALCVMASRIELKKHYLVDVIFGAFFGILATGTVLFLVS